MAESKADLEHKLAALQARYVAQLKDRLDEIETVFALLRAQLPQDQAVESLQRLCQFTHKLAGSGATYGFSDLSDTARLIENACVAVLESPHEFSAPQLRELDDLVRRLREVAPASQEISQTEVSMGQSDQPQAGDAES